ncbi:MAG: histidine triad nucleotide-binding protein [Rhodocyclaceae bacterium]
MSDCIFCRIVKGDIPSDKLYEDDELLAFRDIRPLAPVHLLIIPKRHIATLADCSEQDAPLLGKMLAIVPRLAREAGLAEGFRTIINTGRVGGQEVYHLHVHILGGAQPLPAMLKH